MGGWGLLGNADDYRLSPEREQIRRVLIDAGEPLLPKEVAETLSKDDNSVRQLLWKMEKEGQVISAGSGQYIVNNIDNHKRSNSGNGNNEATGPLSLLPVIQEGLLGDALKDDRG